MELHESRRFSTNKNMFLCKSCQSSRNWSSYQFSLDLDSSCGKPTRRWMRFQHSPAWKHHLHPDPGETVQPILEDGHSHNRSRLATRIWESNMPHFSKKESVLKLGWASAKNNGTVATPYPRHNGDDPAHRRSFSGISAVPGVQLAQSNVQRFNEWPPGISVEFFLDVTWLPHFLAALKGHLSYPILELPQNTDVLTRYQAMEWETIQTVAYEAPLVTGSSSFFCTGFPFFASKIIFVGSFRPRSYFFSKSRSPSKVFGWESSGNRFKVEYRSLP